MAGGDGRAYGGGTCGVADGGAWGGFRRSCRGQSDAGGAGDGGASRCAGPRSQRPRSNADEGADGDGGAAAPDCDRQGARGAGGGLAGARALVVVAAQGAG